MAGRALADRVSFSWKRFLPSGASVLLVADGLYAIHRPGVFVGDGFFGGYGGVTVTGEQGPQAAVIMQPQELIHKGRYVQPRWVDGGNGVQVSEPGYWTDK